MRLQVAAGGRIDFRVAVLSAHIAEVEVLVEGKRVIDETDNVQKALHVAHAAAADCRAQVTDRRTVAAVVVDLVVRMQADRVDLEEDRDVVRMEYHLAAWVRVARILVDDHDSQAGSAHR